MSLCDYVRIDLPWPITDTTLRVMWHGALLMETGGLQNLARNKGSTMMCLKQIQKYLYACFLLKIVISCEINELWGLQETDKYWNEEVDSEQDNHGYFGTNMIGGGGV